MMNKIRDLIRSIAEDKLNSELNSLHKSDNYDENIYKSNLIQIKIYL